MSGLRRTLPCSVCAHGQVSYSQAAAGRAGAQGQGQGCCGGRGRELVDESRSCRRRGRRGGAKVQRGGFRAVSVQSQRAMAAAGVISASKFPAPCPTPLIFLYLACFVALRRHRYSAEMFLLPRIRCFPLCPCPPPPFLQVCVRRCPQGPSGARPQLWRAHLHCHSRPPERLPGVQPGGAASLFVCVGSMLGLHCD